MKRKLLLGASLLAGAAAFAAPAPAQAADAIDETSCTAKEIVQCVREMIVCAPPGCVPPGTADLIRRLVASIEVDVDQACRLVTGEDCP